MNTVTIRTIEDAEKWISVLHRWAVQDALRMGVIEVRLDLLETPWWRLRKRKEQHRYLESLRRRFNSALSARFF